MHPEVLRRQFMAMVCDIDAFCKRFEQNLQNLVVSLYNGPDKN